MSKKILVTIITIASVVVVLMGSVLIAVGIGLGSGSAVKKVDNVVAAHTDSGVIGCQKISDSAKNSKSDSSDSDSETTVAEYEKAKQPFLDSRYADVKVAGTNLLNGMEAMEKAANSDDDSDFGAALIGLGELHTNWTALQVACANHGVTLPSLPTS